jgi:hypothetical protein
MAYKKKTKAFAMITAELLGIILNEDPKLGKTLLDSVAQFIALCNGDVAARQRFNEALHDTKPTMSVELTAEERAMLLGRSGSPDIEILDGIRGQLDFSTLEDNSDVALPEYQTVGEILDNTAGFKVMAVRGDQALNTWDVRIQDNPDPSVWRVISSGLSEQKAKRYAVGLQNVFNYVGSSTPETDLQPTVVPK